MDNSPVKYKLVIENFRSWAGTHVFDINSVNFLFGANSSGKSSIIHAMLLMKQSLIPQRPGLSSISSGQLTLANLVANGEEIDLGSIKDQVFSKPRKNEVKNVTKKRLKLAFGLRCLVNEALFKKYDSHRTRASWRRRQGPQRLRDDIANLEATNPKAKSYINSIEYIDLKFSFSDNGKLENISLYFDTNLMLSVAIEKGPRGYDRHVKYSITEAAAFWNSISNFEETSKETDTDNEAYEYMKERVKFLTVSIEEGRADLEAMPSEDKLIKKQQIKKIELLERQKKDILKRISQEELLELDTRFFNNDELQNMLQDINAQNIQLNRETLNLGSFIYFNMNAANRVKNEENNLKLSRVQKFQSNIDKIAKGKFGINLFSFVRFLFDEFSHLISAFDYLGPHRERPKRLEFVNPNQFTAQLGSRGENLVSVLKNINRDNQNLINYWLEKLEIPYSLKLITRMRRYDILQVVVIDRNGREVALSDVGYGIGQVLPVVFISLLNKNSMIAIEQPELHLHPQHQANLTDLFLYSSEFNHNCFFLETHSEHMILRLQRRIKEQNENLTKPKEFIEKRVQAKKEFLYRKGIGPIPKFRDTRKSTVINVVTIDSGTRKSRNEPVKLSVDGKFTNSWPGGFFEERFFEKGFK